MDMDELAKRTAWTCLKWVEADSDPFEPDDYQKCQEVIRAAFDKVYDYAYGKGYDEAPTA